jgi:hypothetical protein
MLISDILTDDVSFYKTKGNVHVIIAGDFNSRVGLKADYVDNDEMKVLLPGFADFCTSQKVKRCDCK